MTGLTAIERFGTKLTVQGAEYIRSKLGMFARSEVKANILDIPTTRKVLHEDLTEKGYEFKKVSHGGYTTYTHANGNKVTIKPNGEVIHTKRVWNNENTQKYSERQGYYGSRLEEQTHSTGHSVEPFVGPIRFPSYP